MSSDPSNKIESVLQEERVFKPSLDFSKRSKISSLQQYQNMLEKAKADPETFWGDAAKKEIEWFPKFSIKETLREAWKDDEIPFAMKK